MDEAIMLRSKFVFQKMQLNLGLALPVLLETIHIYLKKSQQFMKRNK